VVDSALIPHDRAIRYVRSRAHAAQSNALLRIAHLLERAGEPATVAGSLIAHLRHDARVTLNFHPDRLLANGLTVAEGLSRDGVYRSQFETRISNGSRTAVSGGERDTWERTLFGGAYHEPVTEAAARPKYGAFDVMGHADGGSPRFGSSYLVLRSHVTPRCTFTWGDSHLGPEHVGTHEALESIVAAMLETAESGASVLGVRGLSVGALLRRLEERDGPPADASPVRAAPGRALDEYIEAQVHGRIELSADVAALVIDPSFLGTPTGDVLSTLGERFGFPVHEHQGFALPADNVPADFRGPRMVILGQRIAREYAGASGMIDAASIGRAAAGFWREPGAWGEWGSEEEMLQGLKQMWHVVVGFGEWR
jgi:hypothetical protein